eukprot:CAMPEP_0172789564 /NCGR_PEP_ID=MMETSP1074-20121228/207522_1 /TAXON_ID=2916 /ORGANISM="Ceratium fusus, Strain PA161109" /LENGTH=33 /DNA_ID= /DNA_START= /DNA_END= /DNA_ORIENTATION=
MAGGMARGTSCIRRTPPALKVSAGAREHQGYGS